MTKIAISFAALALTACGQADPAPRGEPRTAFAAPAPDRAPAATVDNPFAGDADGNDVTADNVAADGTGEGNAEMARSSPGDGGATTTKTAADILPADPVAARSCSDGKRVCGDMDDCGDAVFHLQQCGMSRLDGDGDGTPCERICG